MAATILEKVELGEARRTVSLALKQATMSVVGPVAASIFVHIEADRQNRRYREGG
jgi:hypothetical protein